MDLWVRLMMWKAWMAENRLDCGEANIPFFPLWNVLAEIINITALPQLEVTVTFIANVSVFSENISNLFYWSAPEPELRPLLWDICTLGDHRAKGLWNNKALHALLMSSSVNLFGIITAISQSLITVFLKHVFGRHGHHSLVLSPSPPPPPPPPPPTPLPHWDSGHAQHLLFLIFISS